MSRQNQPLKAAGDVSLTSVMIEPRSPHTDDDVLDLLQKANLSHVARLAPGFISASVPSSLMSALENMANVTVKTRKQLRSE